MRFDPLAVKARVPMLDLLATEGVAVRRSGPNFVASCPFHEEKSASFTVYVYDGAERDHAYCFGCGWAGDAIKFYQAKRAVDFPAALEALGTRAGLTPEERADLHRRAKWIPRPEDAREKPLLPPWKKLNAAGAAKLAGLRGLSVAGIEAAQAAGRLYGCMWPQWERGGKWRDGNDAAPCWVVTDESGHVAQFRRLDGQGFVINEKPVKCWTKGTPTWPLGAAALGERVNVLWVEGGADLLAAYHFLEAFRRLRAVAVVAMLGAAMRINEEALPHFSRKRVRIMMDDDQPGLEAAARWTEQLTSAGAAVESFSLGGLTRREGGAVKDLNDLAMVEEAAWLDPELRAAFLDFDF